MIIEMAEAMLQEECSREGLLKEGWSTAISNRMKRSFGMCNYTYKTITLSKTLVEANSEERVRNTILHEIAHAIAGHTAGHGWKWRQVAQMLGCDARRCFSSENTVIPQGKYTLTCPACGKTSQRQKRTHRTPSCGKCSRRYDPTKILVWSQNY